LQQLGLYREAFRTLQTLTLNREDTSLQVTCLRSLSNTIRVIGAIGLPSESGLTEKPKLSELANLCGVDLNDDDTSNYLDQATKLLEKAKKLLPDRALLQTEILIDLGNLSRDAYHRSQDAYERVKTPKGKEDIPQFITKTLALYQQAIEQPTSLIQLQATLNQFNFLIEVDRWLSEISEPQFVTITEVVNDRLKKQRSNFSALLNQLEKLPANQATFQMRLNLVHGLLPSSTAAEKTLIEALLIQTQAEAKKLGDRAAESYALGYRGWLEELQSPQSKNWLPAYQLTDTALKLAEDLQSPQLAYEWQWQQGRILREMGNQKGAIAAYETALKTLDKLRRDLLGLGNPDLQFSFRDRVEPVYREFVELLLQSPATNPTELNRTPEVIKALQVAELENYLRCRLDQQNTISLEKVDDSKVAVVYSVILNDRIDIMLKLPQQSLKYYRGKPVTRRIVEETIDKLKSEIGDNSIGGKLAEHEGASSPFHQLYQWLLQPIDQEIQNQQIKTLIFVPDGSLKSIPLSVLYDGDTKQYVLEKPYSIALNLGLQFSESNFINLEKSRILLAGLSQSVRNRNLPALTFVKAELAAIQSLIPIRQQKQLLDSDFTIAAFGKQAVQNPASIVHIATHGEFHSDPDKTYLAALDDNINLNQLAQLLQTRSGSQTTPIELLILSACKTAQGDRRALLGMAGVAYRAGAKSTIASLKLVNDQSTAELMKFFYLALKQPGTSRAEALRSAQLKVKAQKGYDKPFFWGTFVLLGNWN
jgi:CHAT domain-containing protein